MTNQQWETIEQTLAGLSVAERLEVAGRILRSIPTESSVDDRVCRQREALNRLCWTVDAMPTVDIRDGLNNRDHDRLISTQ